MTLYDRFILIQSWSKLTVTIDIESYVHSNWIFLPINTHPPPSLSTKNSSIPLHSIVASKHLMTIQMIKWQSYAIFIAFFDIMGVHSLWSWAWKSSNFIHHSSQSREAFLNSLRYIYLIWIYTDLTIKIWFYLFSHKLSILTPNFSNHFQTLLNLFKNNYHMFLIYFGQVFWSSKDIICRKELFTLISILYFYLLDLDYYAYFLASSSFVHVFIYCEVAK